MKHLILFYVAFICQTFLGFTVNGATADGTGNWKAGTAKVVITPDKPLWMAGYAARNKPSEGILHDLWAKALALEDSLGNRAVLITTDLLGVTKSISDHIRDKLKERYSLSRSQIILNSSHTHSGPVLQDALLDIYDLDTIQLKNIAQYSKKLEGQIISLVGKAFDNLKSVKLYTKNGVTRFQVNRRNNVESTILYQNAIKGPSDFAVPVLKVETTEGDLMAIAFGYACHPTVLNINKWSGDYPGYAQLELEKDHPGTMALFFQGAGANQNPLPRRSIGLARQYGRELAAAVERVLEEEMLELSPRLKTAYSEIALSIEIPTEEELASVFELWQSDEDIPDFQLRWANRLINKIRSGESLRSSYPFPLQIWQLGDQIILSMGGETLVEYAITFKQVFGYETFVIGYSNDVMSYIPPAYVIEEGGYEGSLAQCVYGLPGDWKKSIESSIYREMFQLASQLEINIPEKIIQEIMMKANPSKPKIIEAKKYYSGYEDAHDTYHAISAASDGKIYYILSSQTYDKGGQMYVYDPTTDQIAFLADLTDVCGENAAKAISQGKSHVKFYENEGKLFFATHIGYYEIIDGMERLPMHAPDDFKLYPGGHILSYNLISGEFKDLAIAPEGEGIITMTMDKKRGHIYGITWPKGYFIDYNLNTGTMKNLGLVSSQGEAGTPGKDYRVLCRSMFVDPEVGNVYFSTSEGDIYFYNPGEEGLNKMEEVNLRLDYFGTYDPTNPGSMGYNWRTITWHPKEKVAYGVHGNSGYLFRFDPQRSTLEIVERLTSEASKKSGMFDYFSYGYLGFQLGPDQETLYYLTGGPLLEDGKRIRGKKEIAMGAARGLENLHLITFHIPSNQYTDHGTIFYKDGTRPTYVNSIAIGPNGHIYTLARFEHQGKMIQDLVKIPNPFLKK